MTIHKFGHHISSSSSSSSSIEHKYYSYLNITLTGAKAGHSYALSNFNRYYIFPIESGEIYSITIVPSDTTLIVNNRIYDSSNGKGIKLKKGDRLKFIPSPTATINTLFVEIVLTCPLILKEN